MIVLLNGLSRGGKDTVANHLARNYGFHHMKISTCLKNCVSQMFDIPLEHLENDQKDKIDDRYNKTPRDILKFVGTDFGQIHLEELLPGTKRCFWVNRMIDEMKKTRFQRFVVSDYRFLHEYNALKNAFPAHTVHVFKIVPNYYGYTNPPAHESETPLRADYIIYNTYKTKLYEDIDDLINNLKI